MKNDAEGTVWVADYVTSFGPSGAERTVYVQSARAKLTSKFATLSSGSSAGNSLRLGGRIRLERNVEAFDTAQDAAQALRARLMKERDAHLAILSTVDNAINQTERILLNYERNGEPHV